MCLCEGAVSGYSTCAAMKSVKSVMNSVAAGDVSHLREAAEAKIAHAQTAVRQRIAGAVAGEGGVDEAMMRLHKRLVTLQANHDQIVIALKHQAERARKNGKTLKEIEAPLQKLGATPALFAGFQAHLTEDEALARAWEFYAIELETSLIAPAKAELGGLFLEAESTYSKYLATVNELGAKQGKERLQKKVQGEEKAERAHEKVEELLVRKAQMEQERLPKLETIAECVEAGIAYLLERHRAFRTTFFGVAQLAASNPQAAEACAAVADARLPPRYCYLWPSVTVAPPTAPPTPSPTRTNARGRPFHPSRIRRHVTPVTPVTHVTGGGGGGGTRLAVCDR